MQAVNLLPAYARPAGRWGNVGKELAPSRVIKIGGIVAAACAILIAGLYFYEQSVVNTRQGQLTDAQARLTAVEATAAPLRTAQTESQARSTVVRTVDGSRVVWETVLADLSRVLPRQIHLLSLNATSPTAAAPVTLGPAPVATPGAVPTAFTVTGLSGSQVLVALTLDRMALLPWLSDVTLQSVTHTTAQGGGAADQFSIAANFAPPTTATAAGAR